MLAALPLFALLQSLSGDPSSAARPATFNGRASELRARVPRAESAVRVDGTLDEPAWGSAIVLTGFSQFSPTDGVAPHDSTEVLVWYSPTAT